MWLPECAVDDTTLTILAEEGVAATILAPGQIAPSGRSILRRRGVDGGRVGPRHEQATPLAASVETRARRRPRRVRRRPLARHRLRPRQALERGDRRARAAAAGEGLAVVATDGETFGHHHRWGERAIAYALTVEAPRHDIAVATTDGARALSRPPHEARVRTSAWSCAHGVERWRRDCGCSTGGEPGWNQAWRTPLRAALDIVRDALTEVFERRGKAVFHDPWAARDAYIEVVLRDSALYEFVAEHVAR